MKANPSPRVAMIRTGERAPGVRFRVKSRVVCCLLFLLVGCKSFQMPPPPVDDITPIKKARNEAAAKQFEQRRNAAEFQAAQAAWDRGDVDACRQTLEVLLRRNPTHRDARVLMADVCVGDGRPQDAANHLEQAAAAHPDDPGVHQAMGVLMDKLGRPENALAHYRRANALAQAAPSNGASPPQATLPPGEVILCDAESRDVSRPNAQAVDLNRRGAAALAAGATNEATALFRDAASQNPSDPQIPLASIITALRYNRTDVAVLLAEQAMTTFPDYAPLLRTTGAAYYRAGDYESSQLVLQQALSLDKSDAMAYFLMGCTLTKLGQSDAAASHWRRAEQLCPALAQHAVPETVSR